MAASETPIYAGTIQSTVTAVPGSAATSYTLFTGAASVGSVLEQLRLYTKTATTRTVRLELTDGATTVTLCRFATGATQYAVFNLMTSVYLPVDDTDPHFVLAPGQILKLTTEGTENAALDLIAIGASFAYPN